MQLHESFVDARAGKRAAVSSVYCAALSSPESRIYCWGLGAVYVVSTREPAAVAQTTPFKDMCVIVELSKSKKN